MAQTELEYCRRRSEQEQSLVRSASNTVAAAAHGELAAAYAERMAKLAAPGERPDSAD